MTLITTSSSAEDLLMTLLAEFAPGGQCRYYMTGPENFLHHGWWRIDALDAPRRIEFVNGLAGDDGEPVPDLEPVAGVVRADRHRHSHDDLLPVRRHRADGAARAGHAVGHEHRDRPDRRAARARPRRLITHPGQEVAHVFVAHR